MINLERAYGAAARMLKEALLSVDPMTFDDGRAAAIRVRAGAIVRTLNVMAESWTREAIGAEAKKAARKARTALEILGKKPKHLAVDMPELRLGDKTLEILVRANRSILDTVDKYLTAAMMATRTVKTAQVQEFNIDEAGGAFDVYAAEAVKTEQSRSWLARKILEWMESNLAEMSVININGKMWSMRKYAELVARTSLRQAQTAATKNQCRQYENDLVIILGHGSDKCGVCPDYENNVYSLSGKDSDYPRLDQEPPFHPNCVHSMHPISREAIEVEKGWS